MYTNISHGSEVLQNGALTASTDTDYVYFFCPKCPPRHILRLLDFRIMNNVLGNRYNGHVKSKAVIEFTLDFECYCERCGYRDLFKISNTGWQEGELP